MKEVPVTASTGQISLSLEELYGNLFLKSNIEKADVYLDGKSTRCDVFSKPCGLISYSLPDGVRTEIVSKDEFIDKLPK